MNIKVVVRAFCAAICLAGPAASRADDTDIYLSTNTEISSTPLVMFTIDVRPNVMNAEYCKPFTGNATAENPDDCYEKVGPEIYEKLNEADLKYDQFDYVTYGVTKFDAFRALHAALYSDLEGVSIGLMVMHDEASGGGAGGAYVLRGFREFEAGDANGAKQELLDKLYSIPTSGSSTSSTSSTSTSGEAGGGTCVTGPADSHTETDSPLTYTVSDISVTENNNAVFQIAVTGTVAKNKSAALSWNTSAGTASAGLDFTSVSSSKTWTAPKNSALTVNETITVTVDLAEDGVVEPSEAFTLEVNAGNKAKSAVATATVCDAPAGGGGGAITVSVDDPAPVKEGENAVFAITLSKASTGTVNVEYKTQGGVPGVSYTSKSGIATFAPGEVSQSVAVATLLDPNAATDTFSLLLTNPASVVIGETVTLADDTGLATVAELGDCVTAQPKKNWAHAFQGPAAYFELFRYLTGQDVYHGGEGDGLSDYGTADATDLDEECWKPGGEGILAWDEGGPKPLEPDNEVYVQQNGRYISPLTDAQQCTDVYALNMLFGPAAADNQNLKTDAGQSTENGGLGISLDSGGNQWPQLIEHLGKTDLGDESVDGWEYEYGAPSGVQKLNTYILELGGAGGRFNDYANSGATVIDGTSQNMEEILEVFRELFRQILSVSTTFVSASVPVDVFNRAAVNDNVFIALFTTDPELKASWVGNLKKLKLFEKTTGGFILYDKAEADKAPTQQNPPLSAIGTDGRIRYGALTFWTHPGALPAPPTDPAPDDEARFMEAGEDGRFVARGGAGQNIPGFIASTSAPTPGTPGLNNSTSGARKLFTEATGSNTAVSTDDLTPIGDTGLAPLDVGAASALYTDLNVVDPATEVTSPTTAANLLCYARGLADADGDGNFCDDETARSWILGDALHSRPLPINYGDRDGSAETGTWSKTNPDIRIMMGSNDGFMRMIQNTEASTGGELGVENWAFMPRRVMKNLKALKANNAASPHPYGVDGTVTLLTDAGGDNNIRYQDGDRAWIYFGLRRGGDAIYAMDVSNPDSPALKWVIDSSTEGFEEMTMSFSTPVIGVVQYGSGNRKEVVVFAGGYLGGGSGTTGRTGYDVYADNGTDTGAAKSTDENGDPLPSKGNAVYVVDADTGELIWKVTGDVDATVSDDSDAVIYANADMEHSIAAQVTLVDTNGDGVDDRAYVPDMGGNVWRIDLQRSTTIDNRSSSDTDANIHQWQAVQIAELGNGAAAGSNDRRFMDRIDFVASQYPDSQTAFDALLLGSGDREHPRDTSVDNYFFMLKDANGATPPSNSITPVTVSSLADANCFLGFADDVPDSCDTVDEKAAATAALAKGWRIPMEATGEKVLAPSVTVANEVFFTSYLPEGEPDAEGNPDPCQVGFEGTGRFYAVSLFNGYPAYNQNLNDDLPDGATTRADRYSELKSKGIPSEMVPLGPGYYIRPDLEIGKTSGSSRFRTFWYEKGVD